MKHIGLLGSILGILMVAACSPISAAQPPSATSQLPEPTMPPSAVSSEALIPVGWMTQTTQGCDYEISHPADMHFAQQDPYSATLIVKMENPDEGARNFMYVSVIGPDIQEQVKQGTYQHDVYNFDPAAEEILRSMQVGESKSVHPAASLASFFTFERKPDAQISGYAAQAYENAQAWEFPVGTKEIRYSVAAKGCTYLIGGYMDTTGSDRPGTITETLFEQIVGTVKLMP